MKKVLLPAAMAAAPLWAQPVPESEPVVLEPITVTAGRQSEPQYEVPQPVTVVTREQIERSSPQVLTDLLRGQTGVFTQSSGPGQGIAIIRGLKGSEVLHLVDGMRLNMAFFRNSPNQYIALVDPFNVEQIEVLRGPAATLYGSDAMGGVVQVLTPEHRFDSAGWGFKAGQLIQFSSASLGKISRSYAAAGTGSFSAAGGFTFQDYGRQDIGNGGRQPFTEYHTRAGDGKLLWLPALGHELMLSASYFEVPKLPRYFEIVGGPGGAGTGAARPVFFEPNDRRFIHGRYRFDLPQGEKLEVHLAQQVINDDRSRLVNATTRETEQNQSELNGFTVQATGGLGPLHLVYGGEYYRDEVASARQRTDITTGAVTRRDPTFPDGSSTGSAGVFLNTEWRPASAWLLEGGARYSHVKTDLAATSVSSAAVIEDGDLTAHLGVLYWLTPDLGWTVNVARGFRAPNVFDLGTLGPRPAPSTQLNIPNPNLGPETITTVDTGLKWSGSSLRAETSVFWSRYDNRIEPREPTGNIIPNGTLGCSNAPGCTEVQSQNISEAEFWGIETGARYRFTPALESYATLNYVRGEEFKPNRTPQTNPANRVPPLNGQLGLLYQSGPWLVELYALFADRQDRLDDDDRGDVRINPNGTPGWATLNTRFGWRLLPLLRLQLDLNNLLDQGYREHGSGIDAPGFGVVLTAEAWFE